jgi:hypothetical protein
MPAPQQREDLGTLPYTFSIVGVQKAGTSTLSALLSRHPMVTAPAKKELHYFDDDERDWSMPDHRGYRARRRQPTETVAGDNSPKYIFHPFALNRMRDYNPQMRLIALFRDPIERTFSHWAMLRDRSAWTADWPQFITELRPSRIPARFPANARPRRYMARSGVARGLYGQQLERGFGLFPREQWLLLDFRAFVADHTTVLDRATDHLRIDRFESHPELLHRMSGPARVTGTAPTPEEVAGLAEYYREDLALFGELSGLDVSGWPTSRLLAGEADASELAAKLAAKVAPA